MAKALIALALLLVSLNAFSIFKTGLVHRQTPQLEDIPWPFTICGTGTWTIETLRLGQTPARNVNEDITITGTADDDVSFTQAAIEVKLNGAALHTQYADFVASFGAGDTVQFKYSKFFPSYIPPGSYTLNMYFKNGDSVNGCVSFSFKI